MKAMMESVINQYCGNNIEKLQEIETKKLQKFTMMESTINEYYENNADKLRTMVMKKLKKFGGIENVDYHDFFSVANETFVDVVMKYEAKKGKFKSFLSKCLDNSIKEEMTKRNTQKRNCDIITEDGERIKMTVSLDSTIGSDTDTTIGETLMSPVNVEKEALKDILSEEMSQYLNGLSKKQKEILYLNAQGFGRHEIMKEMGLSGWEYDREIKEITSLEKTFNLRNRQTKEESRMLFEEEHGMGDAKLAVVGGTSRKMDTTILEKFLLEIKDDRILLNYPLQRQMSQWTLEMKSNLVVTAIIDDGIPEFIIVKQIIDGKVRRWLIDGLQRISTFMEYRKDMFRISKKAEDTNIRYQVTKKDDDGNTIYDYIGSPETEWREFDIAGKKYSELPKELQEMFCQYSLRVTEYENCSDEKIEKLIRRYNSSRPMKPAQKGITFLGKRCSAIIKNYAKHATFFKNNVGVGYGPADFKNGNIERTVCESIMTINFPEKWNKSFETISAYLKDNLTDSKLNYFAELVERLEAVVDLETLPLFNTKNSPVLFATFDKFLRMDIPDEKFNDFLKNLKYKLEDEVIDGTSWAELSTKASKDKKIILGKITLLEKLMAKYFNVNVPEKIENFDISKNVKEYVKDFSEIEIIQNLRIDDSNSMIRLALKTLATICEEKDLSDKNIQLIAKRESEKSLENAILCTMDLDSWAKETNENSSIFHEENIPSLVKCTQYVYEENVDEKIAMKWFQSYVEQFDMKGYRRLDSEEALGSLRMLFSLKRKSA